MRKLLGLGLFCVALAGCTNQTRQIRLASLAEPEVCKHCNCYMPASLPADAPCTVCNCGTIARDCYRK